MGLACRKRHLALWLESFWWCDCNYHNVATYRCYCCGSRPPKALRALARRAST